MPPWLQSLTGVPMMGGSSRASRARKDDLRLTHANILRVVADNLPPGSLLKGTVQAVQDKRISASSGIVSANSAMSGSWAGDEGDAGQTAKGLKRKQCIVHRAATSQPASQSKTGCICAHFSIESTYH